MSENDQKEAGQSTGGDASTNATDVPSQHLFPTKVGQAITPYLPPPVVKAIKTLDTQLEPYVGPEGTITIVGSLLLAWMVWQVTKLLLSSVGGGKAIQDDPDEEEILQSSGADGCPFDGTIVLCGPSMAGKTIVFGQLMNGDINNSGALFTVKSIKSNTGYLQMENEIWRIVDTPGHWGPDKMLQMIPLSQVERIVVVVDSTQPVAQAADYLYALWMDATIASGDGPFILIACHKGKHPKAKNVRRIKLQLRSELERISNLKRDSAGSKQNWEDLLSNTPICSSNVGEGGNTMEHVEAFCRTSQVNTRKK